MQRETLEDYPDPPEFQAALLELSKVDSVIQLSVRLVFAF